MKPVSPLLNETFLKKAATVASYYGFSPAEAAFHNIKKTKRVSVARDTHIKRDPLAAEVSSIVRQSAERGFKPIEQPLFLFHASADHPRATFHEHGKHAVHFGLSVIGISGSIAEALMLQTAASILNEVGTRDYCVYVNSIGDRDSTAKFAREAASQLRKHINDMPASLQSAFKRDVFQALQHIAHKEHPLREELPRPMQFLSDASRRHLREVLEFLETTKTPYRIDDALIGHRDCYSKTLFEIRLIPEEDQNGELTLVRGGRCDELTRPYYRGSIPAVSLIIEGGRPRRKTSLAMRNKKPKLYLIQIGFNAKLQSLPLIERLRKSRIPLRQSLGNDLLADQLATVTEQGVPYALIMGQREVLDRTIIFRDMATQSQKIVALDELPAFLQTAIR